MAGVGTNCMGSSACVGTREMEADMVGLLDLTCSVYCAPHVDMHSSTDAPVFAKKKNKKKSMKQVSTMAWPEASNKMNFLWGVFRGFTHSTEAGQAGSGAGRKPEGVAARRNSVVFQILSVLGTYMNLRLNLDSDTILHFWRSTLHLPTSFLHRSGADVSLQID